MCLYVCASVCVHVAITKEHHTGFATGVATNAGKNAGKKARSALKDARGELEVAAKFAWYDQEEQSAYMGMDVCMYMNGYRAKFAWYDQEEQSGESGFSSVSSASQGDGAAWALRTTTAAAGGVDCTLVLDHPGAGASCSKVCGKMTLGRVSAAAGLERCDHARWSRREQARRAWTLWAVRSPLMLHKAPEHQGSAGQHSDNTTITTPSEAHHNIVINTTAGMVGGARLDGVGPRSIKQAQEHQGDLRSINDGVRLDGVGQWPAGQAWLSEVPDGSAIGERERGHACWRPEGLWAEGRALAGGATGRDASVAEVADAAGDTSATHAIGDTSVTACPNRPVWICCIDR